MNSDYGKWNKKPRASKILLSLCAEMKNERAPEIHKGRNDRAWSESFNFTKHLVGVWRDLEDDQSWKYAQSSPLQLLKDLKFDECRADKNELARAEYFWNRRPRLLPIVSYIVWLIAALGLPFWLFVVPAIGYPLLIIFRGDSQHRDRTICPLATSV